MHIQTEERRSLFPQLSINGLIFAKRSGATGAKPWNPRRLKNTGAAPLSLLGCRFTSGVEFEFGDTTLAPGAFVVIARNSAALLSRHGVAAAGQFLGDLDNAGEHLTLVDELGNVLLDVDYADGWFKHTDGDGFTLVARDPGSPPSAWQSKAGWRASHSPGGSPGSGDPALPVPGTIVFNEVLTLSQGGLGRWIELRNTSAQAVKPGNMSGCVPDRTIRKSRFSGPESR